MYILTSYFILFLVPNEPIKPVEHFNGNGKQAEIQKGQYSKSNLLQGPLNNNLENSNRWRRQCII